MNVERICSVIHDQLGETLDSYFICGVTASGEPIARMAVSEKDCERINTMLMAVADAGGIPRVPVVKVNHPIEAQAAEVLN